MFFCVSPAHRFSFPLRVEAALRPHTRGKSYADAKDELRNTYPDRYDNAVFIRGYERGCEFARQPISNTGPRRVA